MTAEFIQTCVSPSSLLDYYAEREGSWMKAGKEIKEAIASTGISGYFEFSVKNLNSHYFTVERMRYHKDLYAIVTNSCVNYIFKIIQ